MSWFVEDRDARKRYFRRLMECVRFAYMTTDELVECMKFDDIFQDDIGIEILSDANLYVPAYNISLQACYLDVLYCNYISKQG